MARSARRSTPSPHSTTRRSRHGQVHSRNRRRHHRRARIRHRRPMRGARPRLGGADPALPAPGLDRARPDRDPQRPARGHPRRAAPGQAPALRPVRGRADQPARDGHRLGEGHGTAHPQRRGVGLPADGRRRRAVGREGPRRDDRAADGPHPGRVLHRLEDPLHPGRRPRGPGARRARRAARRHRRHLADLEPHRPPVVRHRVLERLAHDDVQPRDARVGRRPARRLQHPQAHARRDRAVGHDRRRHRADLRCGHPDRVEPRRPAGRAVRAGGLRARPVEDDLRHGGRAQHQLRRARRSGWRA